jgi:pyruvate dehydrogenase E1 component beta subunit
MEGKMIYDVKGPVPVEEYVIPLGVADIKCQGDDVTIVATSSMVQAALEAAETLAQGGVSAEVVDPRCLKPLDTETILASVRKTNRAVVVDEGCLSYGATAEIASIIADEAFFFLDAPVKRLGALDVPVPMAPSLEFATIPTAEQVVATVQGLFAL